MRSINRALAAMLLTAVLCLPFLSGEAQVIQEVQNSFNLYKQNSLQEKIFVHTDKSVYLPGEIIWFKVYCVDGNDNKPLNLSKVVYVDLVDNSQSSIIQAKILLKNGIGDGSLYVPVTVTNGNYKFRAYTNWMKNFSPDFYFEKAITLVNPLRSPEIGARTEAPPSYDVQFFPEGGNLVGGIASKVAFKAVGANGKGVEIKGAIFDQHNDTVARFSSLKFGMGSFSFTPAAGSYYKAAIRIGANSPIVKDLPEVNGQGFVMAVTDDGSGQLTVTVKTNSNDANLFLFAHTRQVVKAAESVLINNGTAIFKINKNVLGEGISHLTVFNNNKQPVCERLYFKRPTQKLFIEASADAPQYQTRKKVSVSVSAKDAGGQALNPNLSLSVYRVDSLQAVDNDDIFSYLWLNSELKGNIESAGYYLKNANAETDEALDNLMLTQGWRRFQWNQVLNNRHSEFAFLPEYRGHLITAKITNTETNTPAKNIITYLGVPGRRVQLYTSSSDSLGHLLYNTKDFYGPSEIIVQTNPLVDSTYRIDVASPFSEQFTKSVLPKFYVNNTMLSSLKAHSIGIQALNIYSGNSIKRFFDPVVDSSSFFGKPYKSYKLDDFVRFTTMEEDLREYVSEDNIVQSHGHFHIKVLNDRGFLDGDPLVLVDGIPVFNIDKVIGIDPLKVRRLDVVRERYFYGPASAEGIFSFVTYKGDLGGVDLDPHAVVIDYEGLQIHREFYSPVYDTRDQAISRMPDFRNLLYWSPQVDASGKDAASFYTSDQPGKYIGVLQGITNSGKAGSQYFSFDVK
jgi:hypothetical protein